MTRDKATYMAVILCAGVLAIALITILVSGGTGTTLGGPPPCLGLEGKVAECPAA